VRFGCPSDNDSVEQKAIANLKVFQGEWRGIDDLREGGKKGLAMFADHQGESVFFLTNIVFVQDHHVTHKGDEL